MRKLLHIRPFLFTLTLLLLAASCSTVKLEKWSKAPNANLANYKTFNLYDVSTPTDIPLEYMPRVEIVRTEMIKYMESLGLKRVTENPDLLVNIGIVIEEKIQTRETDLRTDAPRYMGQRNYSWQSEEVEVGRYNQGTVTLDWVDRVEAKMVYHFVLSSIMAKKSETTPTNIEAGKKLISQKLTEIK